MLDLSPSQWSHLQQMEQTLWARLMQGFGIKEFAVLQAVICNELRGC